jgi:hypothetical protein
MAQIFDAPTKLFLESQVSLIVDAVQLLKFIEESMLAIHDGKDKELKHVFCIRAFWHLTKSQNIFCETQLTFV